MITPTLLAVEFEISGLGAYRAQINGAGFLQLLLRNAATGNFDHVHTVEHIQAGQTAHRLFSAKGQTFASGGAG